MSKDASGSSSSRRSHFFSDFKWAMIRAKPLDHDTVLETPLNRNMSMLDILMYGIGAMLGNSIFGVCTVVMRKFTGTSTFISFLIAGFAALLNGLCYSELSSHIPRAGSAYAYTYVIAGEFLAFVTGWLMMLEYCLSVMSAAICASYNLDILTNGTISSFLIEKVGRLGGEFGADSYLNPYYNFPAFGLCILATFILCTGNTGSSSVNVFFTSITIAVVALATLYMYAKLNIHTVNLVMEPANFFSNGGEGLVSGSGIAFMAFIGFDAISVAGEEARNPRRSIPLAINAAVLCVIFITVVHSLALALYVPWWHVNAEMGLAYVFNTLDSEWLRYTVGVAAVLATTANLICCLYAIPRIAYSMADDGLIFGWLGWIWPKTKVPIISLFISGIFCALVSLVLKYSTVVSFLSAGTLVAYTFVACDVIILRFLKPELYRNKGEEVGYLYRPFKRLTFLAGTQFGLVVTIALSIYTILCLITLVYLWNTSSFIFNGYWWAILVIVLFALGLILCVVIIAMHRHHHGGEHFRMPLVPFIPLLCIFVDVNLIIRLPVITWARVGIWLVLGMFVYFGYGIRRSRLTALKNPDKSEYMDLPGASVEDPEIQPTKAPLEYSAPSPELEPEPEQEPEPAEDSLPSSRRSSRRSSPPASPPASPTAPPADPKDSEMDEEAAEKKPILSRAKTLT